MMSHYLGTFYPVEPLSYFKDIREGKTTYIKVPEGFDIRLQQRPDMNHTPSFSENGVPLETFFTTTLTFVIKKTDMSLTLSDVKVLAYSWFNEIISSKNMTKFWFDDKYLYNIVHAGSMEISSENEAFNEGLYGSINVTMSSLKFRDMGYRQGSKLLSDLAFNDFGDQTIGEYEYRSVILYGDTTLPKLDYTHNPNYTTNTSVAPTDPSSVSDDVVYPEDKVEPDYEQGRLAKTLPDPPKVEIGNEPQVMASEAPYVDMEGYVAKRSTATGSGVEGEWIWDGSGGISGYTHIRRGQDKTPLWTSSIPTEYMDRKTLLRLHNAPISNYIIEPPFVYDNSILSDNIKANFLYFSKNNLDETIRAKIGYESGADKIVGKRTYRLRDDSPWGDLSWRDEQIAYDTANDKNAIYKTFKQSDGWITNPEWSILINTNTKEIYTRPWRGFSKGYEWDKDGGLDGLPPTKSKVLDFKKWEGPLPRLGGLHKSWRDMVAPYREKPKGVIVNDLTAGEEDVPPESPEEEVYTKETDPDTGEVVYYEYQFHISPDAFTTDGLYSKYNDFNAHKLYQTDLIEVMKGLVAEGYVSTGEISGLRNDFGFDLAESKIYLLSIGKAYHKKVISDKTPSKPTTIDPNKAKTQLVVAQYFPSTGPYYDLNGRDMSKFNKEDALFLAKAAGVQNLEKYNTDGFAYVELKEKLIEQGVLEYVVPSERSSAVDQTSWQEQLGDDYTDLYDRTPDYVGETEDENGDPIYYLRYDEELLNPIVAIGAETYRDPITNEVSNAYAYLYHVDLRTVSASTYRGIIDYTIPKYYHNNSKVFRDYIKGKPLATFKSALIDQGFLYTRPRYVYLDITKEEFENMKKEAEEHNAEQLRKYYENQGTDGTKVEEDPLKDLEDISNRDEKDYDTWANLDAQGITDYVTGALNQAGKYIFSEYVPKQKNVDTDITVREAKLLASVNQTYTLGSFTTNKLGDRTDELYTVSVYEKGHVPIFPWLPESGRVPTITHIAHLIYKEVV